MIIRIRIVLFLAYLGLIASGVLFIMGMHGKAFGCILAVGAIVALGGPSPEAWSKATHGRTLKKIE